MTERKPPGTSFESWVDKQIREAAERGDFENLPGTGKPLPGLDRQRDEHWWIKDYLQREGLSADDLLPTPLQLRKEIERLPDTVRDLPSEQDVRDVVEELNLRIVDWLRSGIGPQVQVRPVSTEDVLARWRANRPEDPGTAPATARPGKPATGQAPPARSRRWRRIIHRRRESR
ncbi:MAG: DUF1992 domain-containing protein [Pseudonocardiaceae bacterium]|nr:DUF1992 domain-containing protein [Pseudonocardiaceae bacterium]